MPKEKGKKKCPACASRLKIKTPPGFGNQPILICVNPNCPLKKKKTSSWCS